MESDTVATKNYKLPTISGNMTADVVRDMNALAEAVDTSIKTDIDGHKTKFNSHEKDITHIQVGDNLPTAQAIGGIWVQTGLGESDITGGGGLSIQNAVVSETPPDDEKLLWLSKK